MVDGGGPTEAVAKRNNVGKWHNLYSIIRRTFVRPSNGETLRGGRRRSALHLLPQLLVGGRFLAGIHRIVALLRLRHQQIEHRRLARRVRANRTDHMEAIARRVEEIAPQKGVVQLHLVVDERLRAGPAECVGGGLVAGILGVGGDRSLW